MPDHSSISVDPEVAARFARLGARRCVFASVQVGTNTPRLAELRRRVVGRVRERLTEARDVSRIPALAAFHAGLRECGLDPARARPWLDELFRAVGRGDPFPVINDAVDLAHLAALYFAVPVVALDPARIVPPLRLGLAPEGMTARGPGGRVVELGARPALFDRNGAIASPVADCRHAEPGIAARAVDYVAFVPAIAGAPSGDDIDRHLTNWVAAILGGGSADASFTP